MALGFIKKVFTFGKAGPAEAPTPEERPLLQDDVSLAAESEPHARHEELPVSPVDPVAALEMQTAGGPAGDDAETLALEPVSVADEEEDEALVILPGIEDIIDIGMVPLSLLEAE